MSKSQRKRNFICLLFSWMIILGGTFPFWVKAEEKTQKKQRRSSDKLNVKRLEKKFWSSKDTKFKVVQNRAYPKAGKLSLGSQGGAWNGDSLSTGFLASADLAYYFSEQWGVSATFVNFSLEDSKFTTSFNEDFSKLADTPGLKPNHNKIKNSMTLSLLWIPFYAKMSLMETSIVYFDMGFAFGLGQTGYEQQRHDRHGGNIKKEAVHFSFDIFQYFFFNKSFAFRFDVKNQMISQEREAYTFSQTNADSTDLGAENFFYTSLMVGLTVFF